MLNWRQIEEQFTAKNRVDTPELETLRQAVYAGGKVDRQKADLLVELHKRVRNRSPAFEQFFYQAIKDHVLANGHVGAEETAWLRRMLFHDGKIEDEERKFLHQLRGEVKDAGPEFQALFGEVMKQPQEQHTSGRG